MHALSSLVVFAQCVPSRFVPRASSELASAVIKAGSDYLLQV